MNVIFCTLFIIVMFVPEHSYIFFIDTDVDMADKSDDGKHIENDENIQDQNENQNENDDQNENAEQDQNQKEQQMSENEVPDSEEEQDPEDNEFFQSLVSAAKLVSFKNLLKLICILFF